MGILSVEGRWKGANTTQLMDAFIDWAPRSWGLSPATLCGAPTGGKLPMGLSVRPRIGPNVLVIGDAAGAINPFNGEGIAYGYETGRLAAACVARALSGEGVHALVDYESQLQDAYGLYLPDRPRVRPADQQAGPDANLRAHRHAFPERHGVAAAHHGQPGAPRRARSGRGSPTAP